MRDALKEPAVETISPVMAERYLKSMGQNRPLHDAKVISYAMDMDKGDWSLNGETLKFDSEGRMIDGQHRCQAAILAQKPFKTYVVRGIEDKSAFATIDIGSTRTHGDIFALAGFTDTNNAAGAALLLYYYRKNLLTTRGPKQVEPSRVAKITKGSQFRGGSNSAMSKEVLLEFAMPIKDKLDASLKFVSRTKAGRFATKTLLAACHFLFAEKDPVAADAFMQDLGEGVGLSAHDAVYHLRERLAGLKQAKHKASRWEILLLIIKAWNKRRDGARVGTLRVTEGEEFQRIK